MVTNEVCCGRGGGSDCQLTVSQITCSCYFSLIALLMVGNECIKLASRRRVLNLGKKSISSEINWSWRDWRAHKKSYCWYHIRHSESGPPPPKNTDSLPLPLLSQLCRKVFSMGCPTSHSLRGKCFCLQMSREHGWTCVLGVFWDQCLVLPPNRHGIGSTDSLGGSWSFCSGLTFLPCLFSHYTSAA